MSDDNQEITTEKQACSGSTEAPLLSDDDNLFTCECGCDSFTYVDGILRCHGCKNEFKISNPQNGECDHWMRRFNNETGVYNENWEHCPKYGF